MIKAIDTLYKGNYFRSRTEARWAVYFDALGVRWEYEKEGYDLGDGLRYLPDFWFPDYEAYGEVKPTDELSDIEKRKITQLARQTEKLVIIFSGIPSANSSRALLWRGGTWRLTLNGSERIAPFGCPPRLGLVVVTSPQYHAGKKRLDAIRKAQTKRFEHGAR